MGHADYEQADLDLAQRGRTSVFPWRGQFSPGLVKLLIGESDHPKRVLDPFMGSGTVLYESLRLGLASAGAEVNPAAFIFARIAEVAARPLPARHELLALTARALSERLPALEDEAPIEPSGLLSLDDPREIRHILEATYLLARGNAERATGDGIHRAFATVKARLSEFPQSYPQDVSALPLAADARYLPLADDSFDLAITSPPYVNVFNYHQEFRGAVETLGYRPLAIAQSEIGANRKHRQNRLLTVIQYCLDMSLALDELARVLRPQAQAVMVIGRESRVRKLPFDNGELLGCLIQGTPGLALEKRAERKFTSRFGPLVFEDLLFLRTTPLSSGERSDPEFARAVAVQALVEARGTGADDSVESDLEQAIAKSAGVAPSPPVQPQDAGLSPPVDNLRSTGT